MVGGREKRYVEKWWEVGDSDREDGREETRKGSGKRV